MTADSLSSPNGSVRLIGLPVVSDPRGDLTFVEGGNKRNNKNTEFFLTLSTESSPCTTT